MKIKKQNGITLIALVVTIVVLLILAGVTITMVLGEDGIIAQAKLAATKTQEAEKKQEEDLQNLVEQLDKILDEDLTPPETGKTANDLTEDNYGDYVNYGIDLDSNPNTADWRIFYVGNGTLNGKEEKHVYLIAADYVPNSCKELEEAKGPEKANMTVYSGEGYDNCTCIWEYNNGNPQIAYHCNDGHNTELNASKPQCSFPDLFIPNGTHCNTRYYCSEHVGTGEIGQANANSRCASALQCTGNWSSFKDGAQNGTSNPDKDYVEYAIGGPTLEMWVESWDQVHGDDDSEGEKTGKTLYVNGSDGTKTGYYVGDNSSCTTYYSDLSSTPGYDDTLYFPHKTYQNLKLFDTTTPDSGGKASCNGYWLSSPSANGSSSLMVVYFSGNVGDISFNSYCGVRPVVCLKSDVKLTETAGSLEGSTVWNLSK